MNRSLIFFLFAATISLLPRFSSCRNVCTMVNCEETQYCVNGKCVPRTKSCPQNEEFRECGSDCEGKCPEYDEHERPSKSFVKFDLCTGVCIPNVCQCQRGFVRHSSGFCILPSDCRPHNLGRRSPEKVVPFVSSDCLYDFLFSKFKC